MGQHEYEAQRSTLLAAFTELKKRRRVFVGEDISILFENRETACGVLHESLRANGSWQQPRLEHEREEHQHLVPTSGVLSATFMLHGGDISQGIQLCEQLSEDSSSVMKLHIGDRSIGAQTIRALGTMACPVQYLSFAVGNQSSADLASPIVSVSLSIQAFGATLVRPIPWPTRIALSEQLAEYGEITRVLPMQGASLVPPPSAPATFATRLLTALRIGRRVPHAPRATATQLG
jgi:hypothetical protein